MISVDQLRADRLDDSLPGGLGRLAREGYVYTEATLDHGLTNTCPGHIVMSTGLNPGRTGIPGNSYIDHATGEERYCVDDPDAGSMVLGGQVTRSPRAITATTIGDWLKEQSFGSRVFSVSAKDRAAITMAGKQADGVYWYHSGNARFTTSRFYRDRLPDYVRAFNGEDFFEDGYGRGFPERWEHGAGTWRPDDFVGESTMNQRTSGHPLTIGENRANQVYFSPFIDEATGALARSLLVEEELGLRGATDLLAVSFAATDTVGHLYGPFSAESEDTLVRLDREIGELLDLLDQTYKGQYILAFSADHGVQALPEWLGEQDRSHCPVKSGRIDMTNFGQSVYAHLISEFEVPPEKVTGLLGFAAAGATVNTELANRLGLSVDAIISSLEGFLEAQPFILGAWTEEEIMSVESGFARLYRNSWVAGKSGHLIIQSHEDCLIWRPEGTTHGSPYMYDRAVPLVFFGKGVKNGRSNAPAHSTDIAPTLGSMLGLELPADLDGQIRTEVFLNSED